MDPTKRGAYYGTLSSNFVNLYTADNFAAFAAAEAAYNVSLVPADNALNLVTAYAAGGGRVYVSEFPLQSAPLATLLPGFLATTQGQWFAGNLTAAIATAVLSSIKLQQNMPSVVQTFFAFGYWWREVMDETQWRDKEGSSDSILASSDFFLFARFCEQPFGDHWTAEGELSDQRVLEKTQTAVQSAANSTVQQCISRELDGCLLAWATTKVPHETVRLALQLPYQATNDTDGVVVMHFLVIHFLLSSNETRSSAAPPSLEASFKLPEPLVWGHLTTITTTRHSFQH